MNQSHRDRALARSEQGRATSAALRDAVFETLPSNSEELLIHAHRIQLCNQSGNVWLANDMHNADGECFDGSGRFWNCGSKLCPSCVARQSAKNRKRLRHALEQQRLMIGEHYGLITLTLPHEGLPLLTCRKILLTAWQLFRKRKWFTDTIRGCAKSEEFTLTRRGFNYHCHLLVRSRYVSYHKLRSEWTECLVKAFDFHGKSLSIATADNLAVAHYRRITSLDAAVNEVAKYVTKSDSWSKLRSEDLVAVASIRRFPRMFELLGSFKIPLLASVVDEGDLGEDEAYLDTTSLSDGDSCPGWRGKLQQLGAAAYLTHLGDEISEKSAFRIEQLKHRFPMAKFSRLKAPPNPTPEAVLSLIDRIARPCDECHRPMAHHDRTKTFANACALIVG